MRRRLAGVATLGEVDVLAPEECAAIAATVLDERCHWRSRSSTGRFATVGVNAYMDLASATDVDASYFDHVPTANAFLDERFGSLYSHLSAIFAREIGLTTRYADDLARPGFHIWVGEAIPREPVTSIHFDLQYQRLLHRSPYDRSTGTMSFTLPVALPAAGSALNVWPWCTHPATSAAVAQARASAPDVIEYRLGRALVHTGHLLHQIGATPEVRPGDVRIMLQGHGLVVDESLFLYW